MFFYRYYQNALAGLQTTSGIVANVTIQYQFAAIIDNIVRKVFLCAHLWFHMEPFNVHGERETFDLYLFEFFYYTG